MFVSLAVITLAFLLFVGMMKSKGTAPVRLSGEAIERPGSKNGTIIDQFNDKPVKEPIPGGNVNDHGNESEDGLKDDKDTIPNW